MANIIFNPIRSYLFVGQCVVIRYITSVADSNTNITPNEFVQGFTDRWKIASAWAMSVNGDAMMAYGILDIIHLWFRSWLYQNQLWLFNHMPSGNTLTHLGRAMHMCFNNQIIIGSDNGMVPCRHQVIIWTKPVILLLEPPGTIFSEISI